MNTRTHTAAILGGIILLAGCDDTPASVEMFQPLPEPALSKIRGPQGKPAEFMTRNAYLGADIGPILAAQSPGQIPLLVAQTWAQINATDFAERAQALAQEIARKNPDAIGLQEVALFRIQAPGDAVFGGTTPATDVAFDYLQLLMDALAERGLGYRVAAVVENIDIELPAASSPTSFFDVRWTDRDVVLVREDVVVEDAESGNFSVNLSFPVAGVIPITIFRGWNRLDLRIDGKPVHFVNAHLETDESGPVIQEIQAAELIAMLSDVSRPTVLVGDLNALPSGGTAAYGLFIEAGYQDGWISVLGNQPDPGFTCCFDPDLRSGTLFERIDLVLARNPGGGSTEILNVSLVGDRRITASGLNPSDHAGVFARIRFRDRMIAQ